MTNLARKTLTTVSASDATLKSSPGLVHWITISNVHANASTAVELQDGTGPDRWAVVVETSADRDVLPFHANFDPPIRFVTDVRVDITGGTPLVTVGFS